MMDLINGVKDTKQETLTLKLLIIIKLKPFIYRQQEYLAKTVCLIDTLTVKMGSDIGSIKLN
jgi:hypothetical protein